MCYHACGMVHIKDPLLLFERVAQVVVAVGFLNFISLIGPLQYVHCHKTVNRMS